MRTDVVPDVSVAGALTSVLPTVHQMSFLQCHADMMVMLMLVMK